MVNRGIPSAILQGIKSDCRN